MKRNVLKWVNKMENSLGIALVTGASKEIGYALVEELILNGWRVVGVARSKEKLDDMAEKFGNHLFIPDPATL